MRRHLALNDAFQKHPALNLDGFFLYISFPQRCMTPPQPAPERGTGIFCPKPTRQYPTHKVILQLELFEDCYVDMSEPVLVDEVIVSAEQHSGAARHEGQKIFPVAHESNRPEFDHREKDDNKSLKANNSLEARQHFPAHEFHSSLYGAPHAVSELDDDEASESMRYIPPENLNLEF